MNCTSTIGASSIIIAVCALGLSLWQGIALRRHQKLSVKPHLVFFVDEEPNLLKYTISLINNGLGPAIIKKTDIIYENESINGMGAEPIMYVIRQLFPIDKYKHTIHATYLDREYCFSQNQKLDLMNLQFDRKHSNIRSELRDKLNRISIVIYYESFYRDAYATKMGNQLH